MALSFKPLSLQDVKEAYLCGAEDYAHIAESVNPWHKVSEEKDMPKEETFMVTYPAKYCPDYCYYEKHLDRWVVNNLAHPFEKFKKLYTHWMEIPELPISDRGE